MNPDPEANETALTAAQRLARLHFRDDLDESLFEFITATDDGTAVLLVRLTRRQLDPSSSTTSRSLFFVPVQRMLHLLQAPDPRLLVPGTLNPLACDALRAHVPTRGRECESPSDVHRIVLVSDDQVYVRPDEKPLVVTTRGMPGLGYLTVLTTALAQAGLDEPSDRDGLCPVGVINGDDDTSVTLYCLFCTDDMRERVRVAVAGGMWRPMSTIGTPLPEQIRAAVRLRSRLQSLRSGDFVAFRHGKMTDGAFKVGKITRTVGADNCVEVQEYGLRSLRATSLQTRLSSRYLPLYVSSDGIKPLRRGQGVDSDSVPHERIVALTDIYTPGFLLDDDGFLPSDIRKVMTDRVLPRLALFRDRLHRSFLISSRVEALGSRLCLFVASGDTYDEDGLFAVKTRHERGKMLGKSSLTNESLQRCPVCPRNQSSAAVPEQADTRSRAAEDPSPSTREALCLPAALL